MFVAELSALGAAACWSLGGVISVGPARALGALPFNRLRISMAFAMLGALALASGGFATLTWAHGAVVALSAFIGIFVGDTALFSAVRRLGPRRSGILFTANAPITALLGVVFLGEQVCWQVLAGSALTMTGVVLAVYFGHAAGRQHEWEQVRGPLAVGVLFGLCSATCQAVGSIVIKPVLDAGVDPVAASAMRCGVAALGLWLVSGGRSGSPVPLTARLLGRVALSALVGMALGMTLLLHALGNGPAGVVAILSATSPILILPVIWIGTGRRPTGGAMLGAVLAVAGTALLMQR